MTTIRKDLHGGWRAEDIYPLPNDRELHVVTHRVSSGSLVTSANVHLRENGFLTHRMYQDYSRRIFAVKYPRVTKNVVLEQHEDALKEVPGILSEVAVAYRSEDECAAL
jgi:hypothetical protein